MNIYSFDFDEWASLAKFSPDMFEQRRRDYVEHLISKCNDNHRLRGLQCHIDMERIRARTPMKSCLRISSLMWDSFLDCQNALDAFAYGSSPSERVSSLPPQSAQILRFRRKN